MMRFTSIVVALLSLSIAQSPRAEEPGEHFIENWDLDGNGSVSAAELSERRGDVFAAFDANDDSILNNEEYDMFDQARAQDMAGRPGEGRGMRRVSEGMRREANDANGDGEVSLDEFLGGVDEWFAAMDRNGDGEITMADFGRP